MNRSFLRNNLSRTGYLYPDNYMGAGSPKPFTVGGYGDDIIGYYERALVLGQVSAFDNDRRGLAVKLIDLRHMDDSPVYGVVPEEEIFLGRCDKSTGPKTLLAGSLITVCVVGDLSSEYATKGDVFDADYSCSRRKVLSGVRKQLQELDIGETVLGRVCSRGSSWAYKVDVGGGYRIYVPERSLGKHSVHSKGGLTGGLLLLEKTLNSTSGEVDYKPLPDTFGDTTGLLHGAQTRGVLTRADGSGKIYAYIPNCGFVYIAGYIDNKGSNRQLSFNAESGRDNIEIDGRKLQLGCVVQIEVVRVSDGTVCAYIKGILSPDASSGCTLL